MRCPCCNNEIEALPIEFILEVPFGELQEEIVKLLILSYPRALTRDYIIERVYSHRDEPEKVEICMMTYFSRIRNKLKPYGWTISGSTGKHTRLYRLVRLGQ